MLALVGLVAIVGLAFVYQLGLEKIPLIYISFVLTAVFGGAMGVIGSRIVNIGHCRSVLFAALIALLLLAVGMTAKHYFQYRALASQIADVRMKQLVEENGVDRKVVEEFRSELLDQTYQGMSFLKHFQVRSDIGISVGRGGGNGAPLTGLPIYILWLVEAGVIAWLGVRPPISAARQPYSETMNQWADEAEQVMTLPVTNDEMVAQIKAATQVEQLLQIPIPKDDQSNQFAVYTVNSIPGQELEDAYLSVNLVTLSVNNKGETETKENPLVRHAILSSENRKQLVENAELLNEAMEDYRQALAEEAAEKSAEQSAESRADLESPPE